MDRLGEISVPTLVMAGRDDVLSPSEHQGQLAAGIPRARLQIVERAGHEPYSQRPAEVMAAITDFISADAPGGLTHRLTGLTERQTLSEAGLALLSGQQRSTNPDLVPGRAPRHAGLAGSFPVW